MISPLDIRQHNFKRGMRGYDTDEVRTYLNALAGEVQGLQQQLADQKLELERLRTANGRYQETEQMLHRTLQQAELSSKAVVDNAKREAELILAEADQRANEMLQKAYDERTRLDNDLGDLYARRAEALQQIERFLTTQTEQIRTFNDNEASRLPRAEPPRKRAVRAGSALPLLSDPPSELTATPAAVLPPVPVFTAVPEHAVVVELDVLPATTATTATPAALANDLPAPVERDRPIVAAPSSPEPLLQPTRKLAPVVERSPSILAALQPALHDNNPVRTPAPKPESEPAESAESANVLKKKRASFFDEALATSGKNAAVDDLLDDL
jgi:cell division initiation protein